MLLVRLWKYVNRAKAWSHVLPLARGSKSVLTAGTPAKWPCCPILLPSLPRNACASMPMARIRILERVQTPDPSAAALHRLECAPWCRMLCQALQRSLIPLGQCPLVASWLCPTSCRPRAGPPSTAFASMCLILSTPIVHPVCSSHHRTPRSALLAPVSSAPHLTLCRSAPTLTLPFFTSCITPVTLDKTSLTLNLSHSIRRDKERERETGRAECAAQAARISSAARPLSSPQLL